MKTLLLRISISNNSITIGKHLKNNWLLPFFILNSVLCTSQRGVSTKGMVNMVKYTANVKQVSPVKNTSHKKHFIADSLINNSKVFIKKGDFQKALQTIDQSLKLYKELNNHHGIGNCLNTIGSIYYYQGDYPKALSLYEQSIDFYQKALYKKGVSSTLNNIGAIYYYLGNYPKALDHYKKAVKLQEELRDQKLAASITQNIGGIYLELNDYPNAMRHFQKAMKVYKDTSNKNAISQILNGIGEIYMKKGDYQNSLINLKSSLQLAEEIKNKQKIIESLFNLGTAYSFQNKYNTSLAYYNRCLLLSQEIKSMLYNSLSLIAIGSIKYELSDHTSAINYCKKGLKIARELSAISVQRDACNCLYKVYKSIDKKEKALVYHEQMNLFDDSLQVKQTSDKILNMVFEKQVLIDSIANVEKRRILEFEHQEVLQKKEKQRNIVLGIGLVMLIIALAIWGQLRYVRKSKALLQIEKDRSEHLLLNILPEEIAQELKQKGYVDAQDFDTASILFTDFKSFTETAAQLSPHELVEEINTCFKAFDTIIEKSGIEKIKTIGDAYMAAGGLPKPSINSVKKTILAGIEMQEFIAKRKLENENQKKPAFEMRVGIHVGPIVAGIVGVKKFQYDIWGDTVNTASRMESNGVIGKVNISQDVYHIVKNESTLSFEYRGKIDVKGKGDIEMYFVTKSN